MKKSTLTLLILLVSAMGWAQIVTTTPTIITDDYTGTIEVVFDATKGTAGLKDFYRRCVCTYRSNYRQKHHQFRLEICSDPLAKHYKPGTGQHN